MTRLTFVGVVLAALLMTGSVATAQQGIDERRPALEEARAQYRTAVEAFVERLNTLGRVNELGMRPVLNPARPIIIDGTVVYADDFVLDPDTNNVDAVGNVYVLVWNQGRIMSQVEADRLTISEPTRLGQEEQ